jgi:hypothetical protein
VLAPYVREGLEHGEQVFNVVSPEARPHQTDRLAGAGAPCFEAQREGRFVLRDWSETYLQDEQFDPRAMESKVRDAVAAVRREGFSRLRCWGDMSWVRDRPEVVDRVLEYENLADGLAAEFDDDVFACAYDVACLAPRVLAKVVALHPMVVFDDHLFENSLG